MSYITINNKNIYYKQYGEGEAIVFLNGMLMSTNSWSPFIRTVSKNYNMVAVDLLDQGKTDDFDKYYTIDTQVQILYRVLSELKFDKVNLLGMSYGGKVALDFTIKYPNKVKSLILSNTDSYTTDTMKGIAKYWVEAASTLNPFVFLNSIIPYMYSYSYYKKNYEDIKKIEKPFNKIMNEKWYHRFKRALASVDNFNIYSQLQSIKVPTLIISSELDIVTPIEYQELIHRQIKDSMWQIIEGVGHASMYEKPEEFIFIVMKFLENVESDRI